MTLSIAIHCLFIADLMVLAILMAYLGTKISRQRNALFILSGLLPGALFLSGSYLFVATLQPHLGAQLIVLSFILLPLFGMPISHSFARGDAKTWKVFWPCYYTVQIAIFIYLLHSLVAGNLIEWVTSILDQPIILIKPANRIWFLNIIGTCILSVLCFDSTVRGADQQQKESLKFVVISFLGVTTFFVYASYSVLISSSLTQGTLIAGAAVIALSLVFLNYGFLKYPLWDIKIQVSRHFIFGVLSISAVAGYLILAVSLLELSQTLDRFGVKRLLPVAIFATVAGLIVSYLSPSIRRRIVSFLTENFFRNKYDYRDLWTRFSEKSNAVIDLREMLPKIREFVGDAMLVHHVAIWLQSSGSDTAYTLTQIQSPTDADPIADFGLRRIKQPTAAELNAIFTVGDQSRATILESEEPFSRAGIERYVFVEKDNYILAILGVGGFHGRQGQSAEDDRFMLSVSNQLASLIVRQKLAEEVLLAREWESFNRFASFVIHDLKNLATLQGMTLENAKRLSHDPAFLADAFAAFTQTTDKMIALIAGLSLQRGQFSLKPQPVNILEVIDQTFDALQLRKRPNVKITTQFPPEDRPPIISGDPELLQKVFTNLLLNATQSLPKGEGMVNITVGDDNAGNVTASIRDTGCGIAPEQLQNIFRPFQTTKETGMGIGLCHTRSIVEVHGGHMRIDSQVNRGTTVELEFPKT